MLTIKTFCVEPQHTKVYYLLLISFYLHCRYNQQEPLNYDDYEAQGSARQSSQQRNNQQFNTNQLFNNNNNNNNQQYDNNQDFGRNSNSNSNSNDGFTRKAQNDFRSDNSGNFRSEQTTFIPIIRFDKEQTLDGSYKTRYIWLSVLNRKSIVNYLLINVWLHHSWETGNNIVAEETGVLKNFGGDSQDAVVQQGSFSYTSPEGTLITVQYTADEQGFRATGDHLPTPPPIPAEIQKGLDIIYAGIKQQVCKNNFSNFILLSVSYDVRCDVDLLPLITSD